MAKKKSLSQQHPSLKWLLLIFIIAVLLLIFKMNSHKSVNDNTNHQNNSVTPAVSINNWKSYEDKVNGYAIKYPENWSYQEVTNGGGTSIRFYENGVTPRQTYMMARGMSN